VSSAPSRSSADPVATALDAAVHHLVRAVTAVAASNPVVLIDGRSGAGKSSLTRALVDAWPLAGRVQSVALDSIYPGWDGLDDGVELAREQILVPHARGLIGVWERWNWSTEQPAEAHAVDPALPLIVEGVGILTAATAGLSDVRVWLESPAASRRHRALARDGDAYRPHWDRWARQEEFHIQRDEPARLATHVFAIP
jgi:energy-coupling factor transporter ATP-binding protein EcfA2